MEFIIGFAVTNYLALKPNEETNQLQLRLPNGKKEVIDVNPSTRMSEVVGYVKNLLSVSSVKIFTV